MSVLPVSDAVTGANPITTWERRLEQAVDDSAAQAKQHQRHKLTARQRVAQLLDPGSFNELDALVTHRSTAFGLAAQHPPGDGVVAGHGLVDGRPVCVWAQDFTVFGGSLGEAHGRKITKVQDLAFRLGIPIIGISDGGGARIQEGVDALVQFAEIFRRNVAASGVVPQISLILGPSAGGAVYSPALTDFIVMCQGTSQMFITGPDVIKAVTGEAITVEELGGASTHASRSGVAHYLAEDENDAIDFTKALLSYLPQNNLSDPPQIDPPAPDDASHGKTDLDNIVPPHDSLPYDMRAVIHEIVDDEFLEVQALYAANVLVGFARIAGQPIGIIANQPLVLAGALDIAASEKAARFVRTCDAFDIPILTLVDVPGFLPGASQEWDGIIRRGAKLIYAYAEATVPLVTVITRKAYGGAYIVMGSKLLGADINLAWPTAQIAVMGAEGAVNILHRRTLAATPVEQQADLRSSLVTEYTQNLIHPYEAAARGYLDKVIAPRQTRQEVTAAFQLLASKRVTRPDRKHGNIPL
ncbi:MAG: acyl-CoA carboxylase subunit beta [Bifidobacteriaceae bacterium]|nr:acyl-CoA carboxylase subunit beta [Bifidobacteriaceae bacterium]